MILTLISAASMLFTISTTLVNENEKIELLHDFAGNEFKLVEGINCYSIYNENWIMLEKSYESNSPYYSYKE